MNYQAAPNSDAVVFHAKGQSLLDVEIEAGKQLLQQALQHVRRSREAVKILKLNGHGKAAGPAASEI